MRTFKPRTTETLMAELVEQMEAEFLSPAEHKRMMNTARLIAQRTGRTLDDVLTAAQ